MNDREKLKALISMLLAFRSNTDLTDVIDKKLSEICPDEVDEVRATIKGSWQ